MSRRPEAWKVSAFTSRPFSGNPAGVVPVADGLEDGYMQQAARELNDISETVFIEAGGDGDWEYRFRYFTSSCEVDLCGHATIAGLFVLAWSGRIRGSEGTVPVRISTRAGILNTGVNFRRGLPVRAFLEQPEPRTAPAPGSELAAAILGLDPNLLDPALPVGCAFTGLWACFAPLRSVEDLGRVHVDRERIQELWPGNPDLTGVYPFAFEDASTTRGRFFVPPKFGIEEDPVTGTACGALGAFLYANARWPAAGHLRARQGVEMGRGGEVWVERTKGGRMTAGGAACPIFRGRLLA